MNYPTPGFTMNFIVAQSKYYEYVNQIISSFRVASKGENFHLHTANTTPTRSNGISASVIFFAIFPPPTSTNIELLVENLWSVELMLCGF